MRNVTVFAIFCVTLVTALAVPTPSISTEITADKNVAIQYRGSWMSDMIRAILGMSVGELLSQINSSMEQLKSLIIAGTTELMDLVNLVDSNTQQEIKKILNHAVAESLTILTPILDDLTLVLPAITKKANTKDAADLIQAILGISLEQLLIDITTALELSERLLTKTMTDLKNLAGRVSDPNVAIALRKISDEYLEKGRSVILPVLDSLYKVLPSKMNPNGLVSNFISKSLGFDVVQAADTLDRTLQEIDQVLSVKVAELHKLLENADVDVQINVKDIFNKTRQDIGNTVKPILNVFLQFLPSKDETAKQSIGLIHDIIYSLLGVSLEDFLKYTDFATKKVRDLYNQAISDITFTASITPALTPVRTLLLTTSERIDLILRPFLLMISPILGDRTWIPTETYIEMTRSLLVDPPRSKIFCDFSLRNGFNKDLIIHLVSQAFQFDILTAGTRLEGSLQEINDLYVRASDELNEIMCDAKPDQIRAVNEIIQIALNETQATVLPILDVFLNFVPNPARYDKDIVADIIRSLNRVDYDTMQRYIHYSLNRVDEIANRTALDLHNAVSKLETSGHHQIAYKLDRLVRKTFRSNNKAIKPFLETISPILQTPLKK